MAITVSCVIPLYNHERYIRQALDSLYVQTVPPDQIVVVDDGSSDNSVAVVRQFQEELGLVIDLVQQSNHGAHVAIATGIERSSADVIQILNSDDVLMPRRFEVIKAVMESQPSVGLLLSAVDFIHEGDAESGEEWYWRALHYYTETRDLAAALIIGNFAVSTSNLAFRREVYSLVGPFRDFRYCHDLDWLLRFALAGLGWTFLPEPLLGYRRHGNNTISESQKAVVQEEAIAVGDFREKLRGLGMHEWVSLRGALAQRGFLL